MLDREVKRGSTEMLILALVEDRPRHGYDIAKLIEQRSDGLLQFHVASLLSIALSARETRSNQRPMGREGGTKAPAVLQANHQWTENPGRAAENLEGLFCRFGPRGGNQSCVVSARRSAECG